MERLLICQVLASVVLASIIANSQGSVPYLRLASTNYTNHSYFEFSDIGPPDSLTDLECRTDLETCCNDADGSHRGNWYYPNGTRLSFNGNALNFLRRSQSVDLSRIEDADVSSAAEGIYRCTIDTNAFNATGETIYVGLYPTGGKT